MRLPRSSGAVVIIASLNVHRFFPAKYRQDPVADVQEIANIR
jgi:hypothetical protein